jgi:CDP-4-dehydro-6-deoxyglucose reductase
MTSHDVRLVPHERTIRARDDAPVLEAALAAGLNLPHSCKSGHCGSCRAKLITGRIEYPRGVVPPGLNATEVEAGDVLLCKAHARSDLVVRARFIRSVTDVEIRTLPCRIDRMTALAPDVMQVFLRLPAVERFTFQPGQYLDVLLDGGRRRSFSIASPPHDAGLLELHVRRVEGGGFTSRLFDELAPGALLRIEGPIGQFVYEASDAPLLLVAGGTGFAPIKSILRHVLETTSRGRIQFYWGARSGVDLYEDALVRQWAAQGVRLTYVPVRSDADGLVHEAVLRQFGDLSSCDVYAAGPPAMIEAIRANFPSRGVDPGRLRFDSFDYAPR